MQAVYNRIQAVYNGQMNTLCHRCHGELPQRGAGGERGGPSRLDETLLFCPHCSAPQIMLPEHMRIETEGQKAAASSTGTLPPPQPGTGTQTAGTEAIDWRTAIASSAYVACVGAALTVAGLRFHVFSVLSTFWVMGAAVIALGLYTRKRPQRRINGAVGMRIGAVSGLMLIATMGIALAATGVITRFSTHGMTGFDATLSQQLDVMRTQTIEKLKEQNPAPDVQAKLLNFMDSAEVRAGLVLLYAGFVGFLILLISLGGGAFSGMMIGAKGGPGGASRPGN